MACYFGIYFGNTNMCLAMHKDNKTEVLANAAGYRVTPCVITFLDGSEKVVGLHAKQAMHKNPDSTVTKIKDMLFDSSMEVVEPETKSSTKTISKRNNGAKNGLSSLGVEDILSILFANLKEIASSHSRDDAYPAVVTVPLNFSSAQREVVGNAAANAGFQLLRIVSEPAAAALAYNVGQESNDSESNCLVYRMGDTSSSATVLRISNGMYTVQSSVTNKDFGGHLLTDCVVNFCASEFQRQYKVDIKESKRAVLRLRAAAEQYKHVVYGSTSEKCQVESLYDGIDLNVNISKARFDSLIQNTLLQSLESIQEALSVAKLSESDIKTVILTGGSCKIPKLQQLISSKFPSATVLWSINPDEVVAVGAAKEATMVSQNVEDKDCYVNLLSQDISIRMSGLSSGTEELLVCSKGTLIPTVITQSFAVKEDSTLRIEVYEGKSSAVHSAKNLIAVLNMPNMPAGDAYFSFHVRNDGSIFVSCKDCVSKEIGSATIVPPHTAVCT